jgi:N-acetylneuraminate synthase
MTTEINPVPIGSKLVGPGQPVYVVAEIGINHNGDLDVAKKLMDAAAAAGCDAVKFQKRTPELSVPASMRSVMRETPWGLISYLDYRTRIEFEEEDFWAIDRHAKELKIDWFASCWDVAAVDFIEHFEPPCHKVASATLTDHDVLDKLRETGRPVVVSTGMSTMEEIEAALQRLTRTKLIVNHTTSSYPCKVEELNLRMIKALRDWLRVPIGYSGHEVGLSTTWAAVALGACLIERHITLDRAMWGTDQAASVEPDGFRRLVANIRDIEIALGDGVKRVYASESQARQRLRRQPTKPTA